MLRTSFVLILFVCLNGWCAAQITLNAELPELPDFKPVSELRECPAIAEWIVKKWKRFQNVENEENVETL